jgi:hypothetical protein
MTKENGQAIADAPLYDRRRWRLFKAMIRYHLRRMLYSSNFVQGALAKIKPGLAVGAAARFWDDFMSRGRGETYLGGTIEIDYKNSLMGGLIRYRAKAMLTF